MEMTASGTGYDVTQQKATPLEGYRIALAGNPNVGKSTVFNALTGMHQHTGNWAGKTVEGAVGTVMYNGKNYVMTDLPGTYSLRANSAEEEVARDYLCFTKPDAAIVVCDACCLERNLGLVLQTMELTKKVLVCVNLLDEADKKEISVSLSGLEKALGTPVVGITARSGYGLENLMERLEALLRQDVSCETQLDYGSELEPRINALAALISVCLPELPARWAALRFLEQDAAFMERMNLQEVPPHFHSHVQEIRENLEKQGFTAEKIQDTVISSIVRRAETIAGECVRCKCDSDAVDRKIDKILISRRFGIPVMLLLLTVILWLTMVGANYPSALLSKWLFSLGEGLRSMLNFLHTPDKLTGILVDGMYRVLAWVVSVMLPPMAVFFPLFTLLEDAGYLPRVAFNLDKGFRCAGACGKQALTMCMGFGCNAAGVTGCRIIDSPRERLIAILTNCFVPCNGRFPLMISLISMFFITGTALFDSVLSALMLLAVILFGVGMTLLISKLLSRTLLRGVPSSFTLELPPYRCPQVGKVLIRSVLDRTIFVLGRACLVAAPAGMVIYILANVPMQNGTLLSFCAQTLDPFAQYFGMDGTILLAFILGFPANEIVIPIILMSYLNLGSLTNVSDVSTIHSLLVENGWTWVTALCTMLFSLCHFPCSTTVLTIFKETKSLRWTAVSILLPTFCGLLMCFLVHMVCSAF